MTNKPEENQEIIASEENAAEDNAAESAENTAAGPTVSSADRLGTINREFEQYAYDYYEENGEYPEGYAEYYQENYGAFRTTIFNTSDEQEILTKQQIKEIDKRNKEKRKQYHVSNIAILKNYRTYSDEEKQHYSQLFGKRVAKTVWPFFHYVIMIGLVFVILYPLLFMITNAIRPQIETNDTSAVWIPKTITIKENFSKMFSAIKGEYGPRPAVGQKAAIPFHKSVFFNTFVINIGCSVVQVVTCALTGYGFARFKFKGRNLLFGIVIVQMIVPIQIIMIPMLSQFRYFDFFGLLGWIPGFEPLNLTGNPIAMFIMAFFVNGIRAGLFVLLFRQFFRSLPKELEDAAYLDGCGPLETFVRIMVPNAFVSFLTVFIFSVVWYWNDSYVSGVLMSNSPTIAMTIENLWMTISAAEPGHRGQVIGTAESYVVYVQAGCLMSIAPILIMYVFLQKYFVEGVERSGIVG